MTLDEALQLTTETQEVDFKSTFDDSSPSGWCELVKDVVAMANSGGGVVLIGLDDNGSPSPTAPTQVLALDPAQIDDKLFKYTGQHLSNLQVRCTEKVGQPVVAIIVAASRAPIVFLNPGTYPDPDKQAHQKTAFGRGTVYFRHGAKSDVGTTDDIRAAFDRDLASRREEWLGNIRRVIEAPAGATVEVRPPATPEESADAPGLGVRLVHDPAAPAVPHWNPDDTHPHRQKELLAALNARLVEMAANKVNSFDVQCVRRVHGIDTNPTFYHRPLHGSPQYSLAFLEWMLAEYTRDDAFFRTARASDSATK